MPDVFVFLIVIFTGVGDVGVTSSEVNGCPPKEEFITIMEQRKNLENLRNGQLTVFLYNSLKKQQNYKGF